MIDCLYRGPYFSGSRSSRERKTRADKTHVRVTSGRHPCIRQRQHQGWIKDPQRRPDRRTAPQAYGGPVPAPPAFEPGASSRFRASTVTPFCTHLPPVLQDPVRAVWPWPNRTEPRDSQRHQMTSNCMLLSRFSASPQVRICNKNRFKSRHSPRMISPLTWNNGSEG